MRRLQGSLLALCWSRRGAGSPRLDSPLCHWGPDLRRPPLEEAGGAGEQLKEREPHCVGGADVCVLLFWLDPPSPLFSVW